MATQTGPTPGPWCAVSSRTHPEHFGPLPADVEFAWQILTGSTIDYDWGWAVLHSFCERGTIIPSEHDLALAAAAPELLEVCHELLAYVEAERGFAGEADASDDILRARAAIAKAEGEAS